ncbi:MAG: HAMP domain-containing histidine kinase [Lachnospiraceae bacterium]|nr:HAMP domain-containing histidine kinase [Lachnospiraceae bacterium]
MKRKRRRRDVLKTCIIIELIAVLTIAAVCFFLYRSKQAAVRAEVEKYKTELMLNVRPIEGESPLLCGLPAYVEEIDSWRKRVLDDPDYADEFAVAVFGMDGDSCMFLKGDVVLLYNEKCTDISKKEYRETVWNLTEYMTEDSIRVFLDYMEKDRDLPIRILPTVSSFRGRKAEDGTIALTQVTLFCGDWAFSDSRGDREFDKKTFVLQAADYREEDDYTWTLPTTARSDEFKDVNANGDPIEWVDDETHFVAFRQSPRLSGLMEYWTDIERQSRYEAYIVSFGTDEVLPATLGYGFDGAKTMSAVRSLSLGSTGGAEGAMFLLFDIKRIAWNKAKQVILVLIAFGQAFAFAAMILWFEAKRRRSQNKRLRNTFINAMAHELKTPVAVVNNTAEYLATGCKPEKQEHYLGVLTRESASMNELLNRMLTYTRVIDDKVTLTKSEVDLTALTEKVCASYSDMMAAKGMNVLFKNKTPLVVNCDAALMEMVLDNLVSNAVRHGDPDSTIVIEKEEMRFSIWNKTEPLNNTELAEIWTPMFQTDRKAAQSETGGMGLALCAGILNTHGVMYGAYNEKKMIERDGVSREEDGLEFFFDFARVPEIERGRRLAFINLITVGIATTNALIWSFQYINAPSGKWVRYATVVLWLICALLNLMAYVSSKRGPRASRKKKKVKPIGGV